MLNWFDVIVIANIARLISTATNRMLWGKIVVTEALDVFKIWQKKSQKLFKIFEDWCYTCMIMIKLKYVY